MIEVLAGFIGILLIWNVWQMVCIWDLQRNYNRLIKHICKK